MPPLLVIPAMPRTAQTAREALPALPALSELLRLADGADRDADWRSGLLRDLGAGAQPNLPEAVVAAGALRIPAGSSVCLAAPVHAVAGMHRVHLHAAGILELQDDERAALAEGFAAQFGPELRLHAAGNQWLLEALCAVAADDTDPAGWAGAPLERQPASSPEQRQLRRLGAEIEMWLAEQPVNERRRRRGQLPVNLLWLWGGGVVRARQVPPAPPAVQLFGDASDAWLAGCAALAGGVVKPLPAGWSGVEDGGAVVVLHSSPDAPGIEAWDSAWFAPALEDLRAGRLPALRLRVGRRLHEVRDGSLRRLLRRRQPWWQAVGT
ncbi:MAG TPA: hypothetical protein VKO83_12035 [Steroidobacteraceae bacterium]|nr:hypothetical protein [Steroidobacteraceae bacterium]